MISGIGIDIVEKQRFRDAVQRWGDRFLSRLFTEAEIILCKGKGDSFGALAVRFAAKEAVLKAIGTGWTNGVSWKDIEILTGENGRPIVHLHGGVQEIVGKSRVHLSLSHEKGNATAVVVIEQ
ncbi:holo-ACP synthase [candidate division KSB1 bacterium]|nr:holo-ACP synthase [candidate division KSB1 bacterium]